MSTFNNTGYASRRNGSCLVGETDCGPTIAPMHACCPHGTFCPGPQYNVICCPSEANCSSIIGDTCADKSDDVYSSDKELALGGFCCSTDTFAYALENESVGCAPSLDDLTGDMTQLPVISSAVATTSSSISTSTPAATSTTSTSTSSTSASSSPTATNTSASSGSSSSSSSNTGAIAGGVVGGVAGVAILLGLLWFLLRRRNKKASEGDADSPEMQQSFRSPGFREPPRELEGSDSARGEFRSMGSDSHGTASHSAPTELMGSDSGRADPPSELPATAL